MKVIELKRALEGVADDVVVNVATYEYPINLVDIVGLCRVDRTHEDIISDTHEDVPDVIFTIAAAIDIVDMEMQGLIPLNPGSS
jgi:hypothetical protein